MQLLNSVRLAGNILLALLPFALVALFYGLFFNWVIFTDSLPPDFSTIGQIGDSFGILNSAFSGLGFAAVVVTLFLQRRQMKNQENVRLGEVQEKRSLFNLNASIDAENQAYELLRDGNNLRRTWVEASRLLAHSSALGDGVTVEEHRRVLEVSKTRFRPRFAQILDQPPAFFYGVDPRRSSTLDDAARRSTFRTFRIDGEMIDEEIKEIDEKTMYQVWKASEWPESYIDVIGKTFSQKDKFGLSFMAEGALAYLEHIEKWSSFNGELSPRPPKSDNDEETEPT
jgi:hypothetical protein